MQLRAVAQQADVLVGIHGAGISNSWFTRPGSSVIEILFPGWSQNLHWKVNEQDPGSQLHWWGLFVEVSRGRQVAYMHTCMHASCMHAASIGMHGGRACV